jgi:hypothetical protein
MAGLGLPTLVLAGVIVFAGHLVKGVSGFGSALFAVPLLLLILDVKVVTPAFLLFDLTSGLLLVTSNWRFIDRRLSALLFSGMVVGSGIGTWVLVSLDHEILKRILGVLVTGWAGMMLLGKEPEAFAQRGPLGDAMAPLSGLLGGTLGAMFSVNGPPIIIYLSQALDKKQVFRATLCGVFFADACYKLVLFGLGGLLDPKVFKLAAILAPFLVAGVMTGSWIQRFLDQTVFRRFVAGVLTVTGILLLI